MSRVDEIYQDFCSFLGNEGIQFFERRDKYLIIFGFAGKHGKFLVRVAVGDHAGYVLIRVDLPLAISEDRRVGVAELSVRANYGLVSGCFDLDFSDGELQYRTSMPVVDGSVTDEQFSTLLFTAMATADFYYSAFARLLYDLDLSPAEAVAEVEMQTIVTK